MWHFLRIFFICLSCTFYFSAKGQIVQGQDTLYGNEWIQFGQKYYKISVANDGIYHLSYQELVTAGVFSGNEEPAGANFQLFHLGKEVPLFVSASGSMSDNDFIEFYGRKNRGEFDAHLYEQPEIQLNPEYSLFTDTAAYFLTWNTETNHLRMDSANSGLPTALTPEKYCLHTTIVEYHNKYQQGKTYWGDSGSILAQYDVAEGFSNNVFNNNQAQTIRTPEFSTDGADAKWSVRLFLKGRQHQLEFEVNDQVYHNVEDNDWVVLDNQFDVPSTALREQNVLRITGANGENHNFSLATISVEYPHSFNFENASFFSFQLGASNQQRYLEIRNFDTGNTPPVLWDLTNQVRIVTALENGVVKVVIPASSEDMNLVLVNPLAYQYATEMQEVNFTNFTEQEGQYLILSHRSLFDDGNGNNYVQEYADYRASLAGGRHDVVVADVLDIYNQFGYGINRHEQAIRNYVHYAIKNWQAEYLLIIGKGVSYQLMRQEPNRWKEFDFVPSFGYPNSDHLLVADRYTNLPKLAVGRVAAIEPDQIRIYLKKLKEFDQQQAAPQTIADRAWMKRVIHLGGGDPAIQSLIRNELDRLADTLGNSQFGADVVSFYKYSTDVIQEVPNEEVNKVIDNGTSLISFFGHAAPNTLDFDIGKPDVFNNKGRYPLMNIIGCNTNRIFEKASSLSEEYVFIEDKGAIGVFGASWITLLNLLSGYSKVFYQNLGDDLYGETIGKVIQETVLEYSGNNSTRQTSQVLILHGDPALKMYPHEAPDFVVNSEETKIASGFVNVESDSFTLNLSLVNLGLFVEDSLSVLIEHQFPDGTRNEVAKFKVQAPAFKNSYSIQLPLIDKNVVGINTLSIHVDTENEIEESPAAAEGNNTYTFSFVVLSNDVYPIYPNNYGIVSDEQVQLTASTANAFSNSIKYFVEIDTTTEYNSPMVRRETITQKGGIVNWNPNLDWKENTVYYWRVSVDSTLTNGKGFNWRGSSFTYLPGYSPGWNQSHTYQYQEGAFHQLVRDEQFNYENETITLRAKNAVFPAVLFDYEIGFFVNDDQTSFFSCRNGIDLAIWVFDSLFQEKLPNPAVSGTQGQYGSISCFGVNSRQFNFQTNSTAKRENVITFLREVVPDNSYVLFLTIQNNSSGYLPEQWAADSLTLGTNLFQVLEQQGANLIRQTIDEPRPYIFFYKKNDSAFTGGGELLAESQSDIAEINFLIKRKFNQGKFASSSFGPAKSWDSLKWQISEKEASDVVAIDVFGITKEKEEILLHEKITAFDTTLTHISAEQYPYLKLRWNSQDTVNRTTPQLDYWRVLYEPYPEAALAPNLHLQFHTDTLQQGELLTAEIAIANISSTDMDSLLVKYTVVESNNNEIVRFQRLRPLAQQDTLISRLQLDTRTLSGTHKLIIEVNPAGDQLEQFDFNNVGVREFYVETDKRNPILDVTFDGVHILNGDIVSPKPQIIISLEDENQFLALNDTSLFQLRVRFPSGEVQRFPFSDERVTFYPATNAAAGSNKARIELRPEFFEDGLYQLTIAAEDQSGNDAGEKNYTVEFEVINKQMISNVFNYPNPFTTSTQFVFTLTGTEVPQDMLIQIMTVSGRIVREITIAELGPLKIGHNITEFRWDGTDEFGDKLANGVYLYRVVTRNTEGEDMEKYDTGTDQFFTSGIGKMVILR